MAHDGGVSMDVGPKRIHFVTSDAEGGKHPLHVKIFRDHATQLGVEDDKKSFIGRLFLHRLDFLKDHHSFQSTDSERLDDDLDSFPSSEEPRFIDSCSNKVTEIYVTVWISNYVVTDGILVDETDPPSHSIPIACTDRFLSHYDLREDDVLFLQQGKPLPLSRIVISVKNSDAFMWLQKEKFSRGMMLEVCCHDVLLRKHDVFLGSYSSLFLDDQTFREEWFFDMTLSECFPLKQGILTVNTSIVICDDSQNISGRKSRTTSRAENLYVSEFCRQLSGYSGNSQESLNFDVDVQLVDREKLWRQMVRKLETKGSGLDTHTFLGLPRLIMKRYGLFDGAVVQVSLAGDAQSDRDETRVKLVADDSRDEPYHCAIVKCLTEKYDAMNHGFVSPLLIFNLKKLPPLPGNPTLHVKLLGDFSMESDVDEGSQSMSIKESILPTATEVHISIILSPNYSPGASYTEALRSYFLLPRVMSLGDVFALRSSDDPEFWQNVVLDTGVRLPVMFFKVTRMECSSEGSKMECQAPCVIDATRTKLLQVGSVHSYIPQAAYAYLEEKPASYWSRYDCPGLSRYRKKLTSLLLPHLTRQRGGLPQQLTPSVLLCGPVGCGKATVINSVARRLCLHVQQINCHDICGESAGATESRIRNVLLQAGIYAPCIVLLKNIHVIGKERDGTSEDPRVVSSFCQMVGQVAEEIREYPLVIVATTHAASKISPDMHEAFLHHINVENPTETEREDIILSLIENDEAAADISISHIAQRTAGFLLGDLVALVAQARRQAYVKVQRLCKPSGDPLSLEEEESIVSAGVVLEQSDFESALDTLQAAHSDAIGAPKIPNVSWSDVGGLATVKQDILDTIQMPLQHPELLAAGLRRSGVLLYGPPGTGKTLLAKAVATECSLNFLSVKGPELINMYVGQSEANVREVFKRARSASPCVIFFDELDSLAPNRGRSGDSGGVMDRVVSQLLAELDGLHKSREVFVIGATNRPDLLDPALLRPGRFDKLLYLGLCTDHAARLQILKAITRKFHLDKEVDLDQVVDACPEHLTGADFYALCSDTMLNAIKRKIQDQEEGKGGDQSKVVVRQEDFLAAVADLVPSVTEKDLERYRLIQEQLSPKLNKHPC